MCRNLRVEKTCVFDSLGHFYECRCICKQNLWKSLGTVKILYTVNKFSVRFPTKFRPCGQTSHELTMWHMMHMVKPVRLAGVTFVPKLASGYNMTMSHPRPIPTMLRLNHKYYISYITKYIYIYIHYIV